MKVETAVCDACGAGVRDESLFCYNCGGQIGSNSNGSEAVVEESLVEQPPVKEVVATERVPERSKSAPPGAKPALRSAASLRRQRRASNREPVEITWERPSGPGVGFVLATIVLTAGALVLILIALYLR